MLLLELGWLGVQNASNLNIPFQAGLQGTVELKNLLPWNAVVSSS
jgi:hypothetical protein